MSDNPLDEKVRETIEAIRPAVQADGGDIMFHGVDDERRRDRRAGRGLRVLPGLDPHPEGRHRADPQGPGRGRHRGPGRRRGRPRPSSACNRVGCDGGRERSCWSAPGPATARRWPACSPSWSGAASPPARSAAWPTLRRARPTPSASPGRPGPASRRSPRPSCRSCATPATAWPCWPSTPPRPSPVAPSSATGCAWATTPSTTACSSARWPPGATSAGCRWPPRRPSGCSTPSASPGARRDGRRRPGRGRGGGGDRHHRGGGQPRLGRRRAGQQGRPARGRRRVLREQGRPARGRRGPPGPRADARPDRRPGTGAPRSWTPWPPTAPGVADLWAAVLAHRRRHDGQRAASHRERADRVADRASGASWPAACSSRPRPGPQGEGFDAVCAAGGGRCGRPVGSRRPLLADCRSGPADVAG